MVSEISEKHLPAWVPYAVTHYLAHTVAGQSIREIARNAACHPSTILRQIRRLESRRDDQLVDHALVQLSQCFSAQQGPLVKKETLGMVPDQTTEILTEISKHEEEECRVLRRLCETGAVLAVARDMEKAVVVRETDGATTRTAVVDKDIAQTMALKEWIVCPNPGRISRYAITAAGRAAFNKMLARAENQARGFAETQAAFANPHLGEAVDGQLPLASAGRFSVADSPLVALARRRDRDGRRFLGDDLVAAGERLREDFEIAQMCKVPAPHWEAYLVSQGQAHFRGDRGVTPASAAARQRFARALDDLGEGLADVTLRCCCYLEGLESAERRLGWSARSGKIVLRIALIRLSEYYRSQAGGAGRMTG